MGPRSSKALFCIAASADTGSSPAASVCCLIVVRVPVDVIEWCIVQCADILFCTVNIGGFLHLPLE
jgi:hypothetical protein